MVPRPMRPAILVLLVLCSCGSARLVVPMQAENNSGQSGTATLQDSEKGLSVELVIKPIDEPGVQNVHFHNGQCGEISRSILKLPSKEASIALVPISPRDDGMVGSSNLLAGVKLSDVTDGTWVINVHDPRDNALYTSCGNVR